MHYSVSEIKEKCISGIKWVGLSEIVIRILQLVSTIVLARLLGPSIFGTFGICLICFRLINAIGDFGFGTLIVQKRHIEEKLLNTIFVICIAFSTILCFTFYSSASFLQCFFKYDYLARPLRYFSFIFIFATCNTIYRSILIRNLEFFKLTLIEVFSFFLNAGTSIFLACQGMGVWSLIVGLYLENISQALFFIIYGGWTPRPTISLHCIKENLGFAFKITLARIAYFSNSNIDKVLVGKFLGGHLLGIYVIAYGLIDMPVQRISKNVAKVALPVLSKLQDNISEFKKTYKSTKYYLSFVILPIFIGFFIIADEFTVLFYGSQWRTMITPLRILCFAGIFRSFLVISSTSLLALSKPGLEVKLSYLQGLLIFFLMLLLLRFGINAASLAVATAYSIGFFISLSLLLSHVGATFSEYFSLMLHPSAATAIMLFTWLANILVFGKALNDIIFLIMNTGICCIAFIFTIFLMDRSVFSRAKKVFTAGY